ncbi:gem-associated protein 6-like [Eriocheir sinensis]|uniref:gem-associated protein 6-like n=1 Tax=Eriocheir sinensis TaxID=95602 RepID=UPI0021CA95FA|nr:gem-associated protein 6-like [Eriocheir sinensis]XP_050710338.1 gem-associated protein 6-like [Eriocheir sinensis]XP_050710342.1 gem-associated protein 6-like [Eriocheir sinensis]XP_050710344.1 gem-associated protein 6-like [Eriocheir sinensis]
MPREGPSHKIFTGDPVHQHSLIHRRVTVTTTDLKEHTGWVYTIDPVSESVILVNFNGEEKEVNIVWGYNVKSVTPLESTPPPGLAEAVDSIFRKEQVHYSNQELTARRESLCVWLAENRVPYTVKDDMSIQVLQVALIRTPYDAGAVECHNEVVLDKVMRLVQQAPANTST